jgi:hypothetical protein
VLRPDAPRLRDGFTLCSQLSQPQARRAGKLGRGATINATHSLSCLFSKLAPPRPLPQLVGRAVEWLLTAGPQRRGSDASNVLCYGYSRKHPAGVLPLMADAALTASLLPLGSRACFARFSQRLTSAVRARRRAQRAWHAAHRVQAAQHHHRKLVQSCVAGWHLLLLWNVPL